MIKRILFGAIGVVAAAVMISAAAQVIDLEQTTIEDGDGRYVIGAVAAAVFLLCIYLLISDLSRARSAGDLPDAADAGPVISAESGSLADRFAATRAAERAAASNPDVRSPRTVTMTPITPPSVVVPTSAPVEEPRNESNLSNQGTSGRGLFGVTASNHRPATADGLFGRRTPAQPPSADPAPIDTPAVGFTPTTTPEPAVEPTPMDSLASMPPPEPMAPPAAPSNSEPITLRDYLPDAVESVIEQPPSSTPRPSADPPSLTPPSNTTARVEVAEARPTADDLRTLLFAPPGSSAKPSGPDDSIQLPSGPAGEPARGPSEPDDGSQPDHGHLDHGDLDEGHLDDDLPTWQVVADPADGVDGDGSDDDEPPPSGYLYATGGH